MRLRSVVSFAIALFIGVSNAAPVDAIAMGSKHNLYLATCTRRGIDDCPIIILCDKNEAQATTYTAVAYYANGPIETSGNRSPTEIAVVSEPVQPWEGTQRVAKIGRSSSFSSNIDAEAADLEKSELAGQAQLDNENFVCFKDGQTTFGASTDLGLSSYSCTADYWCASLSVD